MSTRTRLAAFLAALVAVFGAAVALGTLVGPTDRAGKAGPGHGGESARSPHAGAADHSGGDEHDAHGAGAAPQGLASAGGGLRLVPARTSFPRGARADFRFRIADAAGRTVEDFDVEHERRMHLIVVRRDLTRYQHVHPVQQRDGSWRVPLRLDDAGTYRVFADFAPRTGERSTLGVDVGVPGRFEPERLPAPAGTATAGPHEVRLSGHAVAGDRSDLRFDVTRRGRTVDVEPYLGADGHLVVLREGDLAYLHAHPESHGGGDGIRFGVAYPSPGRYRLFLQFKHDGAVRTATFTQEVE